MEASYSLPERSKLSTDKLITVFCGDIPVTVCHINMASSFSIPISWGSVFFSFYIPPVMI
jgi:hypothetical protein